MGLADAVKSAKAVAIVGAFAFCFFLFLFALLDARRADARQEITG